METISAVITTKNEEEVVGDLLRSIKNQSCKNFEIILVALSEDGKNWEREPEPITYPQVAPGVSGEVIGWNENNFVYLFAGKKVRYLMLEAGMKNSCYLKDYSVEVKGLEVLP